METQFNLNNFWQEEESTFFTLSPSPSEETSMQISADGYLVFSDEPQTPNFELFRSASPTLAVTQTEISPVVTEEVQEYYTDGNTDRMDWKRMVVGAERTTTVFGRLYSSFGKTEQVRSSMYKLHGKRSYFLLFPKETFNSQQPVQFELIHENAIQNLGNIRAISTPSKKWDTYEISLNNFIPKTFNNRFNTAEMKLSQMNIILYSQEVHIAKHTKASHKPRVVTAPPIPLTENNSAPFTFRLESQNLNNATTQNQIISTRVLCPTGPINMNPSSGYLELYQSLPSYLLMIPKGVFNENSPVDMELQHEGSKHPFLRVDLDTSTSTEWNICKITFSKIPFDNSATFVLKKCFELILTQNGITLISAPFVLLSQRRYSKKRSEPSASEASARTETFEIPPSLLTLEPQDTMHCGLAWKATEQSGTYSHIKSYHYPIRTDHSKGPVLYKEGKYSILIPQVSNLLDTSKPVSFEIRFNFIDYFIGWADKEESENAEWDSYSIDLSTVPFTSGRDKITAELILSQEHLKLTSNRVLIHRKPLKKQRLVESATD